MKLCVLVPAYNCATIIDKVITRLKLPGPDDEIIVVDDGSKDNTVEVARQFPRVHAVRNETNRGYGGTSQRLYEIALERNADFTINIHGDLGHRPEDVPAVVAPLYQGNYDMMLGSRLLYLTHIGQQQGWGKLLNAETRFHMPFSRVLGHFGLTWFQNVCFGTKLHSFHEGMRACNRKVIEWILKNKFTAWYEYDTDVIVHAAFHGFRIGEVPVAPFYDGQPKTASPSIQYGLKIVEYTLRTMRLRPRK